MPAYPGADIRSIGESVSIAVIRSLNSRAVTGVKPIVLGASVGLNCATSRRITSYNVCYTKLLRFEHVLEGSFFMQIERQWLVLVPG